MQRGLQSGWGRGGVFSTESLKKKKPSEILCRYVALLEAVFTRKRKTKNTGGKTNPKRETLQRVSIGRTEGDDAERSDGDFEFVSHPLPIPPPHQS